MNISLAGNLGSGKTSVSELLRKRGYSYVSVGRIFRDIAEKRGITVADVNRLAFTDASIDKEVDEMQIKLGKKRTKAVFDSRLGFYFVPASLKVYLRCDIMEAAKRVMKDTRKGEGYASADNAVAGFMERRKLECERYCKKYGVDIADFSNYDLVIDTTFATPEEVARIILMYAEKKYTGKGFLCHLRACIQHKIQGIYLNMCWNKRADLFIPSVICAAQYGDFYFVVDGHHCVVASLAEGVPFVACSFVVADTIMYKREWCYDFEDFGKFRYPKYPA